jgi:aspartate/methionine/tyrosine aminotransferase
MKYIIVYMGRARPATFVQLGAVAAYTEPRNHVKEIREEYEKRRDFIVPRLNEIEGLSCPMYEGSIYPFVDITQLGIKTADFVKELRQKEKVSVRDGESMGVNLSKGKLRLCVREPVPVLEEACDRMERFVKSLKK